MNLFLIVFSYLFILYIGKNAINDHISKFVLYTFSSYWCISLAATTYLPYGIKEIHTFSYVLLLVGVLSFTFGMISVKSKDLVENTASVFKVNALLEKMLSSKYTMLLISLSVLFLIKYALIAIAVAELQGFADVNDQYNLIFQGNSLAQMIYGYILTPLFHFSLVLMSYYVINFKSFWKKCLVQFIICIFNLLMFIAIGGGRSTIMIVVLYLLITFVCITPKERLIDFPLKKVFYICLTIFLSITAVSLVSNYRNFGTFFVNDNTVESSDGLELLIRYSLLPFVMFDYGIEHDYLNKFGLQFGRATLMGLDNWIYIPMKVLGVQYETASHITNYLEETWIQYDSSGTYANYAYTGLMYHYLDFGYIGIIFFPFLFGHIFRRVILKFIANPRLSLLLLLTMCFFLTMHSVFTCYLIKGWTGLYFIVLFILNKFKK